MAWPGDEKEGMSASLLVETSGIPSFHHALHATYSGQDSKLQNIEQEGNGPIDFRAQCNGSENFE